MKKKIQLSISEKGKLKKQKFTEEGREIMNGKQMKMGKLKKLIEQIKKKKI